MEGPAWENEKVGFRNYFDLRNGMDIFGKKTIEMVLDGVGLHESYHEMQEWGMDILKVANSLGAGAIGLEVEGGLYRIGADTTARFERLYEGPLKSEFKLTYPNMEIAGDVYDITHYVAITAGEYCYENRLLIDHVQENVAFASGIVNAHSDEVYYEEVPGNYHVLMTHAKQAEDSSYLAMGLLIPDSDYLDHGQTPDTGEGITQTYYASMNASATGETAYAFYALWEKTEGKFQEFNEALEVLKNDALKKRNPIKLSKQS